MRTTVVIVCTLITVTSPLLGQEKSSPGAAVAGGNEAKIIELERAVWEAFKNKQTEAFKKYFVSGYQSVFDATAGTIDSDLAAMPTIDLRSYSLSDTKVTFPKPDVAVLTYKSVVDQTVNGKDDPATFTSSSVWVNQNGEWLTAFHCDVKVKPKTP